MLKGVVERIERPNEGIMPITPCKAVVFLKNTVIAKWITGSVDKWFNFGLRYTYMFIMIDLIMLLFVYLVYFLWTNFCRDESKVKDSVYQMRILQNYNI